MNPMKSHDSMTHLLLYYDEKHENNDFISLYHGSDFSNNITVKDNTLNGSLVANVVAGLESFTNNDNHV